MNTIMICEKCGTEIKENETVCSKCGENVILIMLQANLSALN